MQCIDYPSIEGTTSIDYAAGPTPTAIAIPAGATMVHVWADNSQDVWIRSGKSDVAADDNGFKIPAGTGLTTFRTGYHKTNGATHLVIYAVGTPTVSLVFGG